MGRYDDYDDYDGGWAPYVPVAERRANALGEMEKLRKEGVQIQPVERITGRAIARSFWGKGWCDHLESFSDFENRLPRGRTYVRNGSVCHLDIQAGRVDAHVCGSELYKVSICISPLKPEVWKDVKERCRGQIGSMLELLQGRVSDNVMRVVGDRDNGLFPRPGEIKMSCSCPDYATMCKHVAAVLYGAGSRLDTRPELLFVLRGVKAEELIAAAPSLPASGKASAGTSLPEGDLSAIFGIDLDEEEEPKKPAKRPARAAETPPPKASTAGKKDTKTAHQQAGKAKAKAKAKAPKPVTRKSRPAPPPPEPPFDPAAPTSEGVARLRIQSGLSVAEFAEALRVSPETVRRWESKPGPLRIQTAPLAALKRLNKRISRERVA